MGPNQAAQDKSKSSDMEASPEVRAAVRALDDAGEDVDRMRSLAETLTRLRNQEDMRRSEVLRLASSALIAMASTGLRPSTGASQGPAAVGALVRLTTALMPGAAVGPGALAAAASVMAVQETWREAGRSASASRSSPWVPVLPVLATDCLLQALRLVEVAGRGGLTAPAAAALLGAVGAARLLPSPPGGDDTVQRLRGPGNKSDAREAILRAGAIPFAPETAWRVLRDAALSGNGAVGEGEGGWGVAGAGALGMVRTRMPEDARGFASLSGRGVSAVLAGLLSVPVRRDGSWGLSMTRYVDGDEDESDLDGRDTKASSKLRRQGKAGPEQEQEVGKGVSRGSRSGGGDEEKERADEDEAGPGAFATSDERARWWRRRDERRRRRQPFVLRNYSEDRILQAAETEAIRRPSESPVALLTRLVELRGLPLRGGAPQVLPAGLVRGLGQLLMTAPRSLLPPSRHLEGETNQGVDKMDSESIPSRRAEAATRAAQSSATEDVDEGWVHAARMALEQGDGFTGAGADAGLLAAAALALALRPLPRAGQLGALRPASAAAASAPSEAAARVVLTPRADAAVLASLLSSASRAPWRFVATSSSPPSRSSQSVSHASVALASLSREGAAAPVAVLALTDGVLQVA